MSVAMVTQNSAAPSIWASGATAATTPTSDATSFSAATQSGSSSSNTAAPSGVTHPFPATCQRSPGNAGTIATDGNGNYRERRNQHDRDRHDGDQRRDGERDRCLFGAAAPPSSPPFRHPGDRSRQVAGRCGQIAQRSQRRHKPERERGFAHSARWLGGSAGLGGQRWLGQFSLRHPRLIRAPRRNPHPCRQAARSDRFVRASPRIRTGLSPTRFIS